MKAERIQLRKLKPVDLAFMMKLVKDPVTTRYIPALITDEPVMASWISQLDDSKHEYIVELKATGQAIGEYLNNCISILSLASVALRPAALLQRAR